MELKIVNVIASTRIKGSIDVEFLSQKLKHVIYEPGMFPGLILRKTDRPTIIMFASGKISSHGANSEENAKKAISDTLRELLEVGGLIGSCEMEEVRIENVVARTDIGHEIDLNIIAEKLPNTIYEPSQLPGVIYRPYKDSTVCLIFASGKMVIAGAKSEQKIKSTFASVVAILERLACEP